MRVSRCRPFTRFLTSCIVHPNATTYHHMSQLHTMRVSHPIYLTSHKLTCRRNFLRTAALTPLVRRKHDIDYPAHRHCTFKTTEYLLVKMATFLFGALLLLLLTKATALVAVVAYSLVT